ncbi:MAG: type II secretion system protein, partial [Patescibacteria group bacterium]
MKSTKKAFTLVELIVVITILAVLATVAFISLTGYSQDAKNSKVASDVRSLVSAIEAGSAKGDFTIKKLVNTAYDGHMAAGTVSGTTV